MILPAVRDPRLVSIRRGGTLSDTDHQLPAMWPADCAEHVPEHDLGAAACAIKAVQAAAPWGMETASARVERDWQRQPGWFRAPRVKLTLYRLNG